MIYHSSSAKPLRLFPHFFLNCPTMQSTQPGLDRQLHSWGLMQKRMMMIKAADGDVPWEINP